MVTRIAPLLMVLAAVSGCGSGDGAEAKQAALTPAPSKLSQAADVEEPAPASAPAATATATAKANATAKAKEMASAKVTAPSDSAASVASPAEDSTGAAGPGPEETINGRESFSYSGGSRDPFGSLLNLRLGPELADLILVAIYYDTRSPNSSAVVMREKVGGHKYVLRPGDRLGRMRVSTVGPKDATFTIDDFGTERQETVSLRKQEDAQ